MENMGQSKGQKGEAHEGMPKGERDAESGVGQRAVHESHIAPRLQSPLPLDTLQGARVRHHTQHIWSPNITC